MATPVLDLGFGFSPANLVAMRASTQQYRLSVWRTNFQGDVQVQVNGLPPGVSSNAPFTIPSGQSFGVLNLSADANALIQQNTITISGTATVANSQVTKSHTFPLLVSPLVGLFQAATPLPPTFIFMTQRCFDGKYTDQITGHVPDADYHVQFQDAKGSSIGSYVPMFGGHVSGPGNLLSTSWGAGFSPTTSDGHVAYPSTAIGAVQASGGQYAEFGVVLSEVPSGGKKSIPVQSDHAVQFVDLVKKSNSRWFEIYTSNSVEPVYPPQILFSPDCTIALIMEAGTPATKPTAILPCAYYIIDLLSGNYLAGPSGCHGVLSSLPSVSPGFPPAVWIANNRPYAVGTPLL